MKILSLELKGYKRIKLNNIDYLKLVPESKIQLILGTNGAGKSSVIKEISPLPADHREFEKDGFKIIEILHNNSNYILKSLFNSGKNEYHFIKDGEELNQGYTATTFKELVKKEFNITPEVHELMIGSTKFHAMSVADRRNWFTKIADTDYSFALKYYTKLKEQYRDIQGAIKLNQSRLVQESEKLLTKDQEVIERDALLELNKLLEALLELKKPIYNDRTSLVNSIKARDSKIRDISKQIISLRSQFTNQEGFSNLSEIDKAIIDIQSNVQSSDRYIASISKDIEEEQKSMEILQKNDIKSFAEVDQHIDQLTVQIADHKKQLRSGLVFEDPSLSLKALLSVQNNVIEIFNNLEINQNSKYSRTSYESHLDKLKLLTSNKVNLEDIYTSLINKRKELEHFKTHNQIECPNCQHVWIKGYSDKDYSDTLSKIDQAYKSLEACKADIEITNSIIEKSKAYFQLFNAYRNISSTWKELTPLWHYLLESNIIFDNPRSVISYIEDVKVDLQLLCKIDSFNKTLQDNLNIKDLAYKNQAMNLATIQDRLEKLNKTLYDVMNDKRRSIVQLDRLNGYKGTVAVINDLVVTLEALLVQREDEFNELNDVIKTSAYSEAINTVKLEISKREQVLSKVDIQKALVSNIEEQLRDLEDRKDILKILVKEMSPNEGLIAKSLTGFINHFLYQINSFIKKIWLYPLELLPVNIDSDSLDLDYKFEVKINDNSVAADISRLSSGQKEVIDLAFRIVSMQYLKLSNAPIYLDEFAASLDEAHRSAAHYVITNLLTSANFSQIYMVSHYNSSYGSMKNSDILVLHPSNITLPKDTVVNKHVVIR